MSNFYESKLSNLGREIDDEKIIDVDNIITEYNNIETREYRRKWAVNNYAIGIQDPKTHTIYVDDAKISLNF